MTLLLFLAEHRLILAEHAAALLDTSIEGAHDRLKRLARAGLLRRESIFNGGPPWHLITKPGLRMVGSNLPPPRIDVRAYAHDVGVAWLWLAARGGTFGPLRDMISERALRSRDGARDPETEPLAVKLGGTGPRGREGLHYPDLLLITADSRRVDVELEITPKRRVRLEGILAGYGADPRIDAVVYLVEESRVARSVQAAARRVGASSLVCVQPVRTSVTSPVAGRAHGAQRAAGQARDAPRVASRARTAAPALEAGG